MTDLDKKMLYDWFYDRLDEDFFFGILKKKRNFASMNF